MKDISGFLTLIKHLKLLKKRIRARKQQQIYQGQFNACDFVKA